MTVAASNPELERLFAEDQADRERPDDIDWADVAPRDRARCARVAELLDAGEAHTADDFHHAAMVFHHGVEHSDHQRAHHLAMTALALDPGHVRARWLAAAAEDRTLVDLGLPQRYGTQFHTDANGCWSLYPVDPSVSDGERACWNVPPLAETERRVRDENDRRRR